MSVVARASPESPVVFFVKVRACPAPPVCLSAIISVMRHPFFGDGSLWSLLEWCMLFGATRYPDICQTAPIFNREGKPDLP
ncbi:hypothetical protein ACLKA6_016266 [Drosophila palustris]